MTGLNHFRALQTGVPVCEIAGERITYFITADYDKGAISCDLCQKKVDWDCYLSALEENLRPRDFNPEVFSSRFVSVVATIAFVLGMLAMFVAMSLLVVHG